MPLKRRILVALAYAVMGFAACIGFNGGYVALSVYLSNERGVELPDVNDWLLFAACLVLTTTLALLALRERLTATKPPASLGMISCRASARR